MTPKFDTDVQELKYKVLKEVATLALGDAMTPDNTLGIAEKIIPDDAKPTMRCCIYKERAIINQRVKLALGGNPRNPNVVEVLPIACDECPVDGITVTQACRGCIAHNCMNACPKNAITIVNRHATIDKSKCVECGRCAAACSYGAILKLERPCIKACKMKAISINPDNQKAMIKLEKCVSCGACVYQCPFGAISDKSFLTKAIQIIKGSLNNKLYHTYAVVAPSIGAQYTDVKADQVYEALLKLGFYRVEEAAWGADAVAYHEAKELVEEGFLTSSCCPAFVSLVQKNYPDHRAPRVPQPLADGDDGLPDPQEGPHRRDRVHRALHRQEVRDAVHPQQERGQLRHHLRGDAGLDRRRGHRPSVPEGRRADQFLRPTAGASPAAADWRTPSPRPSRRWRAWRTSISRPCPATAWRSATRRC